MMMMMMMMIMVTMLINIKMIMSRQQSWEAQSDPSDLWLLEKTFQQIFLRHEPSIRFQMGHQISDMLLQCTFAGRTCVDSNFTLQLSGRYGNCFTLQYPKFVTRISGPTDGLQLKLFLETDEYVPGVANSKGIQVVIHDQDTIPFPEDEGVAVSAGTETFIALRRVQYYLLFIQCFIYLL
ncbi:amiloride-sensitive sodium channel subunit gamma [Elysia marginata]|uniref:Amiloride-sensitive sodium channel subunit gamma n=1 Tax=Elysia marginata TaxID=1093978 RepID=A0AAV4GCV4_9GAST|nr:amiloride-sensitive sodium channel subunit gamma [Elysia marginata]